MRILLIDDIREFGKQIPAPFTHDEYAHATTFEEGLFLLEYEGPWDFLYLDHDLGEIDPSKTGYDILNWLEVNQRFLPGRIELVTANPVGRQKMQKLIKRLYKYE